MNFNNNVDNRSKLDISNISSQSNSVYTYNPIEKKKVNFIRLVYTAIMN